MTWRAMAAFSACLAGLSLPAAASAQERGEEEPAGEDIVVTGDRAQPSSRDVVRQARTVTQGGYMRHEPMALFQRPVCPGVMGMPVEYAELIVGRIRQNAEAVGLQLGRDGDCQPNVIVMFTPDGAGELDNLHDKHGYVFASLSGEERRELLEGSGPVHVWTTTETRTRDGMPLGETDLNGTRVQIANMWMAHSKIYTSTREDIYGVVVLIDVHAIDGLSVWQLADYATMRALVRTKPPEQAEAMDTILTLFNEGGPEPLGLTDFDWAYIRSAYDSIPNIPGITKVLGVNRQLKLMAEEEEEEEAPRE